jgi:ATP-dependent DNA helicase RecQ
MLRAAWGLLGEGLDEEQIVDRLGRDSTTSMSAGTAARLLRRAAEAAGIAAGDGPMPLDDGVRALKARRDRERLDTMVRYGFSRGCRTRFIYDYFAGRARGGAAPRCGVCDVCLGWGKRDGRALDDAELLRVRIALSGVGRLSGRFGIERIAQVLTGSQVREILDRGLDRVPTFDKLAGIPIGQVKDLLNVLADAGLIERQGIEGGRPGAFVLALTAEGRRVAMGEVRPELALPSEPTARSRSRRARTSTGRRDATGAAAPAAGESGPAPDPALLAQLKAWRTEEARRKSMPPYVIFHDRTLAELAVARPRDLQGLRQVPGIGPAKLEAYGAALLALLGEG